MSGNDSNSTDKPLISGRSPSSRRAAAARGEPASDEALEAGVLLKLIEHELALAIACEGAAENASDAAAILSLRVVASACRHRASALGDALVSRGGSPPRDDEVDVALAHDRRELEDAGANIEPVLAALESERRQKFESVTSEAGDALRRLLAALAAT